MFTNSLCIVGTPAASVSQRHEASKKSERAEGVLAVPSRFKLLTLRTAWLIDQNPSDYASVRKDIAAVKVMPRPATHAILDLVDRL